MYAFPRLDDRQAALRFCRKLETTPEYKALVHGLVLSGAAVRDISELEFWLGEDKDNDERVEPESSFDTLCSLCPNLRQVSSGSSSGGISLSMDNFNRLSRLPNLRGLIDVTLPEFASIDTLLAALSQMRCLRLLQLNSDCPVLDDQGPVARTPLLESHYTFPSLEVIQLGYPNRWKNTGLVSAFVNVR